MHFGTYLAPIRMNLVGAPAAIRPDEQGWCELQGDSGAAMHLMQDELDFVAGWSSSINITACTARKDDTPTSLNRVGPVLRVFKGKDGHGRSVETMQYIGCGACDTEG